MWVMIRRQLVQAAGNENGSKKKMRRSSLKMKVAGDGLLAAADSCPGLSGSLVSAQYSS